MTIEGMNTLEKFAAVLLAPAAVFLVGLGLYAIVRSASADGKVDYCYIDNISGSTGGYQIIGHRSWRPDVHLGVGKSPEDANDVLNGLDVCPNARK